MYKIIDLKYLYKYHAKLALASSEDLLLHQRPPNKKATSEICMDSILPGILALLEIDFKLL